MESKKSYNLVIDTNIWVGAIMGIKVREYLKKILLSTQFTILLNQELLAEISEVLDERNLKSTLMSMKQLKY
jgi:predicted nucleic acid-binding protein